jgi:PIN domain nuclease of toxin-antitoxin system
VNVFDASALLAFLQDEAGADIVERQLEIGGVCGTANWSETAQKVIGGGRDWTLARALLQSFPLAVEPVLLSDAEWAAHRWRSGEGLSLGDRLCLALGERLDATVWTADSGWPDMERIRRIR